ncbi:MAG: Hpt domain-containing protein, partial [Pseudomonadales bacterium]
MSATQDFVALDWIKGEISSTLDQAQQALEAIATSPDDAGSMRACLTHLHQVNGTLKMVELEGPTNLAAEMEELAQALMGNEVPDVGKAQEILMQAILQMPGYLDRIQREQRDTPEIILPVVNNLREARGAERLGDAAMDEAPIIDLSPLSAPPSAEVVEAFKSGKGPAAVKQLRQRYQQALIALVKKQKARENLKLLGKVFTMLIKLCGESPMGNLAWLGLAVVEGIAGGVIKLDSALVGRLKQIDGELKRLSDGGAGALSQPVAEDLGKSLLDSLHSANKDTPRIVAVRERFVTTPITLDTKSENLSFGPDDETLSAVGRILLEELRSITDKLDIYVRSSTRDTQNLVDLLPQLDQITGTLTLVGLADHQNSVREQIDVIRSLEESREKPTEDVLLEMARAFLQIETSLNSLVGDQDGESEGFGDVGEAEAMVIKETRNGLATCKDAIIEYVTNNFDKTKVQDLAGALRALRGGLVMINQTRCADVLSAGAAYVEHRLLSVDTHPALSDMDDLADAITSIDYFLERYLESAKDPYWQMVEVAEAAITKLGFTPGEVHGVAPAAPEAEPISEEVTNEEPDEIEDLAEAAEFELEEMDEAVETVEVPESEPTSEPSASKEPSASAEDDEESLVDDEILEIFIDEAEEVLGAINEFFPLWQKNMADSGALTEVRRAFHTLKGSGRMVGATVIGELAWSIENLLNQVIEGTITADANLLGLIEEVVNRIPEGIEAFKRNDQTAFKTDEMVARAEAIVNQDVSPVDSDETDSEDIDDALVEEVEFDESLFARPAGAQEELSQEGEPEDIALEETASRDEQQAGAEDDSELDEIFLGEAEDRMEIVRAYNSNPGEVTPDLIAAFHTLKGSAAMAEVPTVSSIAAPLETLANLVYNQGIASSGFDELAIQ